MKHLLLLEKWDGLLMKRKLLIFSYQFSGCKHSISVSLNHTVLECLGLELPACTTMPGFYMGSGEQNLDHHLYTLSNFWNGPKHTAAILYHVFMQRGMLNIADCKIKISISSENCWRCFMSCSVNLQPGFNPFYTNKHLYLISMYIWYIYMYTKMF